MVAALANCIGQPGWVWVHCTPLRATVPTPRADGACAAHHPLGRTLSGDMQRAAHDARCAPIRARRAASGMVGNRRACWKPFPWRR